MIVASLLIALSLGQGYAPTREGTAPLDPEREARVQRLGKLLRCAVCQGVSIADSPASMARAQLDKVRELVLQGASDQEIFDYFVERYGEWSLMEPKKSGVTLGLWVFPVILLVGGVVVIFLSARNGPAAPTPSPSGPTDAAAAPPPVVAPPEDPLLAQVRADLEK